MSGRGSPGFLSVRAAGQTGYAYRCELARAAANCNPDCNPGGIGRCASAAGFRGAFASPLRFSTDGLTWLALARLGQERAAEVVGGRLGQLTRSAGACRRRLRPTTLLYSCAALRPAQRSSRIARHRHARPDTGPDRQICVDHSGFAGPSPASRRIPAGLHVSACGPGANGSRRQGPPTA